MAIFLQSGLNDVRWAVWKLDESLDELLALLPEKLRLEYEPELTRFTAIHRKKEWLAVRVLLAAVSFEGPECLDADRLPQVSSIDGSQRSIRYTPEGKPYLSDGSYHISISHTKGYVALAWSRTAPVGIDIEQYGQRIHRVMARFVRSDESIFPYQSDDTWSLLLHWSAKEAVFKRMEKPDADLCKLRVSAFEPHEKGAFEIQEEVTGLQNVYGIGYQIHPDFVLTWTLN